MAELMAIEVAEFIEDGLTLMAKTSTCGFRVRETPLAFLDCLGGAYQAGALGLAFIGKFGDPPAALNRWLEVSNASPAGKFEAAAKLLGIPVALARLVEINHHNGVPAAEIAGRLRIGNLGLIFRSPAARPEAPAATESSGGEDSARASGLPESIPGGPDQLRSRQTSVISA